MTRWEYTTYWFDYDCHRETEANHRDFTDREETMQSIGQEGWELVSVCPDDNEGCPGFRYFFKRPIEKISEDRPG